MPSLPSLAAIRAFEATLRLGGLARAAAELNVSTSAVSHRIRALEALLGTRLMERSTGLGGVRATPSGARLRRAATGALDLLDGACADIRNAGHRLTVSANPSFSAMWLASRLAEFSALHPDTPINAVVHDEEPDYARDGVDLAIVRVVERALRPDETVLLRERVFPVCSPALRRAPLGRCRLLQEAHEDSPELDWTGWAPALGLRAGVEDRIVHYASFSQVIGAAVGGAGLALGRSPLIDPELASGRLVRLRPGLSRPASWCFVLRRAPGRRHRKLGRLIDFLRAEAAAPPALPVRPRHPHHVAAGARVQHP